jgi:hypothetical protein
LDATVQSVTNSIPNAAVMKEAANAGKTVFGNNAVGNFIDDWVNPFGLGKDLMDWTIIGTIAITNNQK